MSNYFLVFPSHGSKPYFIPQCGSVNDTWHNLMRDPDRHLCFETVYLSSFKLFGFDDLYILVDESAKLRPHQVNRCASLFYPGSRFGDYIAGTAMLGRIGLVPYECEDGEVIYEHDILPLTDEQIDFLESFFDEVVTYDLP